jgi:hypothetical protein
MKGAARLPFTMSETFGDKPISDWLVGKVKEFVLDRYGLDVQVTFNPDYVDRDSRATMQS